MFQLVRADGTDIGADGTLDATATPADPMDQRYVLDTDLFERVVDGAHEYVRQVLAAGTTVRLGDLLHARGVEQPAVTAATPDLSAVTGTTGTVLTLTGSNLDSVEAVYVTDGTTDYEATITSKTGVQVKATLTGPAVAANMTAVKVQVLGVVYVLHTW